MASELVRSIAANLAKKRGERKTSPVAQDPAPTTLEEPQTTEPVQEPEPDLATHQRTEVLPVSTQLNDQAKQAILDRKRRRVFVQ